MGKQVVNELRWRIGVDDDSAPGLQSFNKNVQQSTQQAQGFLERMAARARENRMDQRRTGETALQSALSSPAGLTGFAADSLGIGIQTMVADALGNAMNNASKKAIELRDALAAGKITSEEMARQFATSIPVLGNFVGFFLNVRELMTGEQAELDKINKSVKDQEALWEHKKKLLAENKTMLEQHVALMGQLQQQGFATFLGGQAGSDYAAQAQEDTDLAKMRADIEKKRTTLPTVESADAQAVALRERKRKIDEQIRTQTQRISTDPYESTQSQIEASADAKRKIAALQGDRTAIENELAGLQEIYKQRDALAQDESVLQQKEANAQQNKEARKRAHQARMLQIQQDSLRAQGEQAAASFGTDKQKALEARYQTELSMLQANIDAQQKEYDRIKDYAGESAKEEMLARIAAMKDQQGALTAQYGAQAQAAAKEAADKARQQQYRARDQQWEREDAKRRMSELQQDFRERSGLSGVSSTFGIQQMESGQSGFADLFKDRDTYQKDSLQISKEIRDYLKRLDDATREQNRMIERQGRIGTV